MQEISRLPIKNLTGFDSITIVVAAIIIEDSKVLLHTHQNSDWKTVGGKLDQNESLIDCVKREVMEEAGCEIEIIDDEPLCCANPRDDKDVVLMFYYKSKRKNSEEELICNEGEIKWFDVDDLPENIYESTRLAVEYFKKR